MSQLSIQFATARDTFVVGKPRVGRDKKARLCVVCQHALKRRKRKHAVFCSKRCRQKRYRDSLRVRQPSRARLNSRRFMGPLLTPAARRRALEGVSIE